MIEDHINNTLKTVKDNDKDDGNGDEVGQRIYLQTEAMWGGGSIGGCPDYAADLSAFDLCHHCIWLAHCAFS